MPEVKLIRDHHLWTRDTVKNVSGDVTLDISGDINLDAHTGIFNFYDAGDTDDAFQIVVTGGTGATALQTVSDAADGHLDIIADGHIRFPSSGVGFRATEAIFGASGEIGDGGNSTDIDFRIGNKWNLQLTGNITSGSSEYLNFIFPAVSGNFLLVIGQDGTGSRTISSGSWRAYDSGEALCANAIFANGTDGEVRWAGGSAPTLTTTAYKADIISIYWHADSDTAFAVVSQNF